jgi:hypothetical protein
VARIRDLPDTPAPAATARVPIDLAGVGATGSITVADLRNAGSSPVYFATLTNDNGVSDQSAALQAQIDACETAGICEMVLPPYLIWAEGLVISHPLLLRGTGVKVAMNALADGLPSDVGTRLIAKTGASPCIEVVTGANGATITGIQFLQVHAADGPGWAPTVYAPAIRNWAAWTTIEKNSFWGCYDGVRLGKTWAEGGSAYVTIKNNTFACFHRGIHVYKAGDWNLIDGNWFQNYFVEDLTNQRAYIQANAEAMFIERADALAITNNGVFGHLYGIRTGINVDAPTEAEGIAERLKLSNNDFDKVRVGILLVKGCTGSATNTAIAGDNVVGSFAIQGGENVNFEFTNTRTINHGVSAIYAATTGCLMSFTNLTITTCNVDGGNPAMSAVAGATIIRSGKFSQTGAGVVEGGAGTYISGATLTGAETLTNKTLTTPTITGGGSIAGTFSNNPTFSGTVTYSGSIASSGGSLTGSWAGSPTFTGAVGLSAGGSIAGTWSSNPTFSGTVTYSGTLTSSGGTFSGTWAGTPAFSGANFITYANLAQGSARSALGVTGNATANVAAIQGTTDQVFRINQAGTALSFGPINLASSSAVTGTLAVANGGTGNTGGAWSTSSPTVTAGSGTLTSASASLRSMTIGKLYTFSLTVTVTTNGTGATQINVAMPVTATAFCSASAYNATTNIGLIARMSASGTTLAITKYDGTYPVADGQSLVVSGVIEIN